MPKLKNKDLTPGDQIDEVRSKFDKIRMFRTYLRTDSKNPEWYDEVKQDINLVAGFAVGGFFTLLIYGLVNLISH